MSKTPSILCICGKPASGKTTLAGMLGNMGWSVIETSDVIADMLGTQKVRTLVPAEQIRYRQMALGLISGPRPQSLSLELISRILTTKQPTLVSGVRRLSTLEDMRDAGITTVVVFVDTLHHTCVDRFVARGGSARAYQELIRNPIERYWVRLHDHANHHFNNDADLSALKEVATLLQKKYSQLCL